VSNRAAGDTIPLEEVMKAFSDDLADAKRGDAYR